MRVARAVPAFRWAAWCVVLLAAVPRAAAQEAVLPEVLLEMRLRNGPRDVLIALARDSVVLVPLGGFLKLAGIAITEVSAGRRVAGRVEPAGFPFVFDLADSVARGARGALPLGAGDVRWLGSELYVAGPVLAAVFDVEVVTDWASLVLSVERTDHLPVIARARRARRRETLLAARDAPPAVSVPVHHPVADGAVLDWGITSATSDPLAASTVQLGLGLQVLGGSLVAERLTQFAPGPDLHRTTASWVRAWPQRRWLRQIRLGDVLTEGLRPRSVRGAVVTNVPFLRDAAFTTERLQGAYGPGWEVELYRGGRLVGYTTTGDAGRFGIDLPVQYGPNPFELVAYGPFGEVLRDAITFDIPFRRLPAGMFEYAAGGGECRFEPCTAFVNTDLRAGLTDHITVQAGLDAFVRDTLPDLWHPYAAISGAVTRSVSLTADGVVNGLVRGRVDIAPNPDFQLTIAHTRFDQNVTAPVLFAPGSRHSSDGSLFWRPAFAGKRFFLQATGVRLVGALGATEVLRLAGTLRFAGARAVLAVREEAFRPQDGARNARRLVQASADRTLPGPSPLLRGVLVRGTLGAELDVGLDIATAGVGRRFFDTYRIDLGGGWQRGRGAFLELSFTTILPWLRANSRNVLADDGVTGIQLLEGSLLWDARNDRVAFGNGRSLGRAGLAGEIFLDENGNGRADADELRLGGVTVRIGAHTLRADSLGRFALWDLVPFQDTEIQVDTLSLQNPLWTPLATRARVAAGPNTYQYVPIAVVSGGEIAGRAVYADGRAAGGVRVVLRHAATGQVTETVSFSDGAFYAMGLKPGPYEITVARDQLDALGASVEPVRARLRAARGGAILEGVLLTLRPR